MTRVEGDWRSFADRFSKDHDGWSASLQARARDGGVEVAVDDRPFRGLTFEHAAGHDALIFTFGDDADEHLAHIIDSPRDLSVLHGSDGECLLVVGLDDGSGCVLELMNPFEFD